MTHSCLECGNHRILHLGKSSSGWTFTFKGYRSYDAECWNWTEVNQVSNFQEWKQLILDWLALGKPHYIINEYDVVVLPEELFERIESKRNEPNNHAKQCLSGEIPYVNTSNEVVDSEGNSFSFGEFS